MSSNIMKKFPVLVTVVTFLSTMGSAVAQAPSPTPAVTVAPPRHSALALAVVDGAVRLFDDGGGLASVEPFDQDPGFSIYDPHRRSVFHFTGNKVYSIGLDDLEPREVKTIPPPANRCLKPRLSDNLQSADDLRFSKGGKGLCITLRDKGAAAMTTEMIVSVPMEEGNPAATTIFASQKTCGAKVVKVAPCLADAEYGAIAPTASGTRPAVEVEEATCEVKLPGGGRVKVGTDDQGSCALAVEGFSSSSRYVAVSVIVGAGTSIKRRLYLVDIEEKKRIQGLKFDIAGETSITWSPTADAMLVDGTLVLFRPSPRKIPLNRSAVFLK